MKHMVHISVKQTGERSSTRKLVIHEFLHEKPGRGTGEDASRYEYSVEKLRGGGQIYLTRPARLRWGFDFLIHVKDEDFGNGRDYPRHRDIGKDLRRKRRENPGGSAALYKALCRVHACEDPDDVLPGCTGLKFRSGLSAEALLKVVKWLMIEQDIRYWNYSGRDMFKVKVIDPIMGPSTQKKRRR
jgi:hypothetical protein